MWCSHCRAAWHGRRRRPHKPHEPHPPHDRLAISAHGCADHRSASARARRTTKTGSLMTESGMLRGTFWRHLRLLGALACAAGITSALAQTVEVAGVKFEPTVQLDGATLLLNGAGVRTRAIFKVYAAGLYVPQKSTDAAT